MAYYYSPFRKKYDQKEIVTENSSCPFCDSSNQRLQSLKRKDGTIVENKYYIWFVNFYPKFEGHTMVVPKKHVLTLEEEGAEEAHARHHLITYASRILRKYYQGSGVEIFLQTGEGSASSVKHLHWHVLPARPDDPFRAFEKLGHFYTPEENEEKVIMFPIKVEKAKEELQEALAPLITEDPYQDPFRD